MAKCFQQKRDIPMPNCTMTPALLPKWSWFLRVFHGMVSPSRKRFHFPTGNTSHAAQGH